MVNRTLNDKGEFLRETLLLWVLDGGMREHHILRTGRGKVGQKQIMINLCAMKAFGFYPVYYGESLRILGRKAIIYFI